MTNVVIGSVLLWIACAVMLRLLIRRGLLAASVASMGQTLVFILPRITVALIGAGFFADLLPADHMQNLFGADAGVGGIILATVLGPLIPGGAFVSFAVAASALKAGASVAPVITFIMAWSLFSLTKLLVYEVSIIGRRVTAIRFFVSLPFPALAGLILLAIGF